MINKNRLTGGIVSILISAAIVWLTGFDYNNYTQIQWGSIFGATGFFIYGVVCMVKSYTPEKKEVKEEVKVEQKVETKPLYEQQKEISAFDMSPAIERREVMRRSTPNEFRIDKRINMTSSRLLNDVRVKNEQTERWINKEIVSLQKIKEEKLLEMNKQTEQMVNQRKDIEAWARFMKAEYARLSRNIETVEVIKEKTRGID